MDFSAFPTAEELDRMAAEGAARRLAMIEAGGALNGFTPTELGDWLALCSAAAVPAVPALRVASGPTVELWGFDEPNPSEAVRAFYRDLKAAQERFTKGWMLRWSCCSCAEVKSRLSNGDPTWSPDLMDLRVDDFRAFDLIGDFPLPVLSAWARPWMRFDIVAGYPVEYRAFVLDGRLTGISNYYPQRNLVDDDDTERDIAEVSRLTAQLIAAQTKPLNMPQLARSLDLTQNHWTADFARLPSGAVLFLEGGPPHTPTWGAHPCCFMGREPEGVALAASPEALEHMGLS